MTRAEKWDRRFLIEARDVAAYSKDPSTKVGAVIVDNKNRFISQGFNGFARGVEDDPARYANRELKYRLVVHAEVNAILFACRDCSGCTLYTWPFMPCSRCASLVVQSGITRVVAPPIPDALKERWGEDMELSQLIFAEAGVRLDFIDL